MDLTLIAGAVSSLKVASEIASGLIGIRDEAQLQAKIIDLQRIILEAQSGALAAQGHQGDLLDQIRGLKAQLDEMSSWNAIAARYELKQFGNQTYAYELRMDMAHGQPVHRLCPKCFADRHLSILQNSHRGADGRRYYDCWTCGKARPLDV